MLKALLVSTTLVAGLSVVSAQAATHHHARHVRMMHHAHGLSYGIGGNDHRTTATGGNAGGYSTRN